jgi:hypothetical protein
MRRPRCPRPEPAPVGADIATPVAPRRGARVRAILSAALALIAAYYGEQDAQNCVLESLGLAEPSSSNLGPALPAELPPAPRNAGTSLVVKQAARAGAKHLVQLAQLGVLVPPATRRANLARPPWDQSSLNLIITQWPDDAFKRIMHMSRPAFKHVVDTLKTSNCLRDNTCRNKMFRYSAEFKFALCQWHLAYGGTLTQTAVCGGVSSATVQKYLTLGQGFQHTLTRSDSETHPHCQHTQYTGALHHDHVIPWSVPATSPRHTYQVYQVYRFSPRHPVSAWVLVTNVSDVRR